MLHAPVADDVAATRHSVVGSEVPNGGLQEGLNAAHGPSLLMAHRPVPHQACLIAPPVSQHGVLCAASCRGRDARAANNPLM